MIKAILLDIDGVLTDGKLYSDGKETNLKTFNLKDLDAISSLRKEGLIVGCVSGEDTSFSQNLRNYFDFAELGCKDKSKYISNYCNKNGLKLEEIMYVGDGKYDIDALHIVGISVCPADAIFALREKVDWVLSVNGGQGCIAEIYDHYKYIQILSENKMRGSSQMGEEKTEELIQQRIGSHCFLADKISKDMALISEINNLANEIIVSYKRNKKILLCGNGGSAADAQHLEAELVGRFYMERKALPAEALTTNTSIITALANDYDYNLVFSRQLQAKGSEGDILIGITTSGTSKNILLAFEQAKRQGIKTVLMTGEYEEDKFKPIMHMIDYLIAIPSSDTPRIQECHILLGHILCELVENGLFGKKDY